MASAASLMEGKMGRPPRRHLSWVSARMEMPWALPPARRTSTTGLPSPFAAAISASKPMSSTIFPGPWRKLIPSSCWKMMKSMPSQPATSSRVRPSSGGLNMLMVSTGFRTLVPASGVNSRSFFRISAGRAGTLMPTLSHRSAASTLAPPPTPMMPALRPRGSGTLQKATSMSMSSSML